LETLTEIREFDGILDEKHRDVIANQIPIALVGVELGCEASHIADGVSTAPAALDRREANKGRRGSGSVGQHAGISDIGSALQQLELPKRSSSASMYYPFWNAFMVETVDLLTGVTNEVAASIS
jgi:hypothetical protein